MCTVSMIGDHYADKWKDIPGQWIIPSNWPAKEPEVSREEFEELKRDVLEMKELLKRAKKYDEEHDQPDCEIDEKMELLRSIARLVGVNLDDVIAPKPS